MVKKRFQREPPKIRPHPAEDPAVYRANQKVLVKNLHSLATPHGKALFIKMAEQFGAAPKVVDKLLSEARLTPEIVDAFYNRFMRRHREEQAISDDLRGHFKDVLRREGLKLDDLNFLERPIWDAQNRGEFIRELLKKLDPPRQVLVLGLYGLDASGLKAHGFGSAEKIISNFRAAKLPNEKIAQYFEESGWISTALKVRKGII